jgi:hypothetical protein
MELGSPQWKIFAHRQILTPVLHCPPDRRQTEAYFRNQAQAWTTHGSALRPYWGVSVIVSNDIFQSVAAGFFPVTANLKE